MIKSAPPHKNNTTWFVSLCLHNRTLANVPVPTVCNSSKSENFHVFSICGLFTVKLGLTNQIENYFYWIINFAAQKKKSTLNFFYESIYEPKIYEPNEPNEPPNEPNEPKIK